MRLLVFAVFLIGAGLPLCAQYPETGGEPDDSGIPAHAPRARPLADPGANQADAAQDAEAARQKLLKATDQIDMLETNAESNKTAIDGLKTQMGHVQDENSALKAQISTLQDTLAKQQDTIDAMKAERAKERQAIIDEVAQLVASKPVHHAHAEEAESEAAPPRKHASESAADAKPAVHSSEPLAPPPDEPSSGPVKMPPAGKGADDGATATDAAPPSPPAPSHRPKGYTHVVAAHETLSLICEAYRAHGVDVTVAQVRKANGLSAKSTLKTGQKLFIPKPGA